MEYDFYIVSLLYTLEEYIPFMSDEEIRGILYGGDEPDALTVWGWEVRRNVREAILTRQFREAAERQKK